LIILIVLIPSQQQDRNSSSNNSSNNSNKIVIPMTDTVCSTPSSFKITSMALACLYIDCSTSETYRCVELHEVDIFTNLKFICGTMYCSE